LSLDGLTNCISKRVTTTFFASAGNVDGTHLDFISGRAKVIGKRESRREKEGEKGREKKKANWDTVCQVGKFGNGHMTTD